MTIYTYIFCWNEEAALSVIVTVVLMVLDIYAPIYAITC